MHGNVWEWCSDWHGDYATTVVIDPVGPRKGSHRISRGGGWNDSVSSVRSANRGPNDPTIKSNNLGFRVALSQP